MDTLKLRIIERDHLAFESPLIGPLELGRQRSGEPEPYALLPGSADAPARLVIAHSTESNCSRQHILLQPLPSGGVRVTNRSQVALACTGQPAIAPVAAVEMLPPFTLVLDSRSFQVDGSNSVDEFGTQGLDNATIGPGNLADIGRLFCPLPRLSSSQTDELVGWLQTTMGVLASAVGGADFLDKAADALVQIVGLDSGRILLLRGDEWEAVALRGVPGRLSWRPSQHVMSRVRAERRTFWQTASQAADSASLMAVGTVVASPLLDGQGKVIGALYGERRQENLASHSGGKVEALLVDLLACGVSTGLARQEEQRRALQLQVQFEQFFTRELAAELRQHPDLLEGKDAEVTLLFADIRGFSRISGRLKDKPGVMVSWIGDVMTRLSECVLQQEGVVVDYIGDELMAMWGAPRAQADQALRAVQAALAMRRIAADLDRDWRERLGEPMGLGIGVNTGEARVGNTGSRQKFKYGPLGDAVNIASRTQGITKYLRCGLLVTKATKDKLEGQLLTRRVVTVRMVNIKEPMELYEVEAAGSEERRAFFRASEEALEALEQRDFAGAAHRVGALIALHPGDGPLLLTLARAAPMLMYPDGAFDPIWEPPGK